MIGPSKALISILFCEAYHRDKSGGSDLPGEEEHCTLVVCKELLLNAEILKIDLHLLLGFTFSQNKRLQPGETALNCPFGTPAIFSYVLHNNI